MKGLTAAVFDWAGTMVDFGSRAPVEAFAAVFADAGVPLTAEQARGPMGLSKRAHIAALLAEPSVVEAWRAQTGRDPGEAEIDALHAAFEARMASSVVDHAALVPDAADIVRRLRERGLAIGSTTGYSRAIMAPLLPLAAAEGYSPDVLVCTGDVPDGRPGPGLMRHCLAELGVTDPATVIKVDDTVPGLAEGRVVGAWTVAVALSGNAVGLSVAEWEALDHPAQMHRRTSAEAQLRAADPDYIIDSVSDLMGVVDEIEKRLALGQSPRIAG